MHVPASRSSELARIAAEAASGDTSSVRFRVVHGPDPLPALDAPEFSLFSAAGLAMSAGTWPSTTSAFSGTVQIDGPQPDGRRDTSAYEGLTVPNPGFLNESTRRIDVLLTLGSTHWSPTHRDCLMNSLVVERLSMLAARVAGGPVLHLHTPVAPYQEQHVSERGDGSSERLRDAVGPCIRMSVGVEPGHSAARLDFQADVAALADEYGLGLRLDDRRLHRVRGEWFTIRGFDQAKYRQERNLLFPDAPLHTPKRALVATLVGPARVGVAALAAAALRARGIGVLACAVTSMRRIAFINLVLPAANAPGPPPPPWSGDWDHAMKTLVDRCALVHPQLAAEGIDESGVNDYKIAVSAPMRCVYPPSSRRTGASLTGRVPYPLWLAWDVPHPTVGTRGVLEEVKAGLAPYTEQCEVAYVQSRLVSGDVVRGRAKLVVVLARAHRDGVEAQRVLTEAAAYAEERTLERLLALPDVEPERVRLRLSSRERWTAQSR